MVSIDYVNTFIAVAPDLTAVTGTVPPERGGTPTVASRTWQMIADDPYRYTSGDVIFALFAERAGIAPNDRWAAREQYYNVGRACLLSSDLGKRNGWGVHADAEERVGRLRCRFSRLWLARGRGNARWRARGVHSSDARQACLSIGTHCVRKHGMRIQCVRANRIRANRIRAYRIRANRIRANCRRMKCMPTRCIGANCMPTHGIRANRA